MSTGLAAERTQLVQSFVARQRWSRDELLEHQRGALCEIVRHAVARSPYYRERLGADASRDDVRQRANEAWGDLQLHDVYVSTEGGMMATECAQRCGLHVWEDTVILEIVDDRNQPVPPDVPGYRVLLTNLWNRTQPLIRYELEDSVTLAAGANPTGRPFSRIARVDGRSADVLRFPSGSGGEVVVHPIRLRRTFMGLREVLQYQFRHDGEGLRVSLVLAPQAPRDVLDRVRAALVQALEEAGAVPPPIHVKPVDAIPRVGSGAKLTLVESGAHSAEPALAR